MKAKEILKEFNRKPIVYFAIYADITGSVTAGVLLSQILYWWYTMGQKEFYKLDEDWCKELSFGLWELKGAKSKVKETGIVRIARKGNPAKTHYKVDEDRLEELISSCGKNQQQEVGKTTNKLLEKQTTIYTENTSEITSDIATPLQSVVNYFYELKNWDYKDKKYKSIYSRYTKPAKELLELCDGNIKEAQFCIKKVCDWANSRELDWGIETVFKKWYDIDKLLPQVKTKKAYYDGNRMFKNGNQWNVIMPNGEIKKFAGDFNKIQYK